MAICVVPDDSPGTELPPTWDVKEDDSDRDCAVLESYRSMYAGSHL